MTDSLQFVPPPPRPKRVALPGLSRGNILALKLSEGSTVSTGLWPVMAVEHATVLNGDITYYGNSLLFVIGDSVQTFRNLVTPWEGKLQTWTQLATIPAPPKLRIIRLQPIPSTVDEPPVMEVSGLLLVDAAWTPLKRYSLTFRGDWSPLFKQL